MKVEIISRETVKPSSPTPPPLRTFKLSLLDQVMLPVYASHVFFYPSTTNQETIPTAQRSYQLKKSLSETLSRYYPFAGRFKDGFSSIDCNDEGADYIEARVNCELSKVLQKPEIEILNRFLPFDFVTIELDPSVVQLAIQVNNFNCGGLAIGMCFLHKIIDAVSMSKFVNDWASISRGSNEAVSPVFLQDSIYPSRDLSGLFPEVNVESPKDESITASKSKYGRFVFTGSSIAALKAKVSNNISSTTLKHPTRVEVVSSLIWQRIMAACRANPGSRRLPFVVIYLINMRGRMVPPLPGNTIGNMVSDTSVSLRNEKEMELVDLVLQLREAIREIDREYLRDFQGDEWKSRLLEDAKKDEQLFSEADFCAFSSVCRLPLYEADFGWGKPVWISFFNAAMEGCNNNVTLMDTRDGDGIEAWVTLDEKTMEALECDEDLLAFASSNPNVDGIVFISSSL